MDNLKLPFYYAVFSNGINVRDAKWDKISEIPSAYIFLSVINKTESTTSFSNIYCHFDCVITNKLLQQVSFPVGTNIVFAIKLFFNNANSPQQFSYIKLSFIAEDKVVYKLYQFNKIGRVDPMDKLKEAFVFIENFKNLDALKDNPVIDRIDKQSIYIY